MPAFAVSSAALGNMYTCNYTDGTVLILQPASDYRTVDQNVNLTVCQGAPSTTRSMYFAYIKDEKLDAQCLDNAYQRFGHHAISGEALVPRKHSILVANGSAGARGQLLLYTPAPFRHTGEQPFRPAPEGAEKAKKKYRTLCMCKSTFLIPCFVPCACVSKSTFLIPCCFS